MGYKFGQVVGDLTPCENSGPTLVDSRPKERQFDFFSTLALDPINPLGVHHMSYFPYLTHGIQNPQAGAILDPVEILQQTSVTTESSMSAPGAWPGEFEPLDLETSSSTTNVLTRSPSGRSETVEASVGSSQNEQHQEMSKLQSIRSRPCTPGADSFTSRGSLS